MRDARLAAGMSQTQLAARSGVSRQTVGAIEAGRHRPSVDAALALALAVGRSVEALFAPALTAAASLAVVPHPGLRPPVAVLAARVGDHLVHAGADQAIAAGGWPQPNAVLRNGVPTTLPGADLEGFVVVGCDPALGLAASLLPPTGPQRVIAISGSTAAALDAVAGGRAHAAVVHGATGQMPTAPAGTLRVQLARWRVGLAVGSGAPSLTELAELRLPVVQREAGASSQRAFANAMSAAGATELPPGPVERGHLEVARRVALGAAAGVTMEPAALAHGLGFAPLEEHSSELWVAPRFRGHAATEALGRLLRSAAFTARLSLVDGYDLAQTGTETTA